MHVSIWFSPLVASSMCVLNIIQCVYISPKVYGLRSTVLECGNPISLFKYTVEKILSTLN